MIAHSIAHDLGLERESIRVSNIMNAVTDRTLLLRHYSHYTDAAVKLAALCTQVESLTD